MRGCLKRGRKAPKIMRICLISKTKTEIMRAARKSYLTDLTNDQWDVLKEFIPAAKAGGRPRTVDEREVVNAIFYILSAGCPWRMLPHDFPVWQTVYDYFRKWRIAKIWAPINRQLNQWVRVSGGKEATPSVVITDSQSVQIGSTQSEPQAVGCDGGKKVKGRKRHILEGYLGAIDGGCGYCCQYWRTRRCEIGVSQIATALPAII